MFTFVVNETQSYQSWFKVVTKIYIAYKLDFMVIVGFSFAVSKFILLYTKKNKICIYKKFFSEIFAMLFVYIKVRIISLAAQVSGRYSEAPDDALLRSLAVTYASSHGFMAARSSCPGEAPFEGGVTNGAFWYDVPGECPVYFLSCTS